MPWSSNSKSTGARIGVRADVDLSVAVALIVLLTVATVARYGTALFA
jgi:hypothetical protein